MKHRYKSIQGTSKLNGCGSNHGDKARHNVSQSFRNRKDAKKPTTMLLLALPLLGICAFTLPLKKQSAKNESESDFRYLFSAKKTSDEDIIIKKNGSLPSSDFFEKNPSDPSGNCGVWFAPSTIPGSGLGMFAGRSFDTDENLLQTGDIVIPITDIVMFHGSDYKFLWDEYTWTASSMGISHEGYRDVNSLSTGFGAAINNYFDLGNVDEGHPTMTRQEINPGMGAFTAYHDRQASALHPIKAGQELFTDYGTGWFRNKEEMRFVPFPGDIAKAQTLMRSLQRDLNNSIADLVNETQYMITQLKREQNDKKEKKKAKTKRTSGYRGNARVVGALPKTADEYKIATEHGIKQLRLNQTTRTVEWLQKHGTCIDNIRAGPSNIPYAGRGAFATRRLALNNVVAPVPLIHIPNRTLMEEYGIAAFVDEENNLNYKVQDKSKARSYQLMLNYCFGHPESTLLLSPYGHATSLVNHASGSKANVKLRWGDPQYSNHRPEWLQKTVGELDGKYSAVLAFEFIAIREIEEGDEILMDYGPEWEKAWQEHVQSWNVDNFNSLDIKKEDVEQILQKKKPMPPSMQLLGYYVFHNKPKWEKHLSKYGKNFDRLIERDSKSYACEITKWEKDEDSGDFWYWARYTEDDETLVKVPAQAFVLQEKPHQNDPRFFRHHIPIPEGLMPELWKNKH